MVYCGVYNLHKSHIRRVKRKALLLVIGICVIISVCSICLTMIFVIPTKSTILKPPVFVDNGNLQNQESVDEILKSLLNPPKEPLHSKPFVQFFHENLNPPRTIGEDIATTTLTNLPSIPEPKQFPEFKTTTTTFVPPTIVFFPTTATTTTTPPIPPLRSDTLQTATEDPDLNNWTTIEGNEEDHSILSQMPTAIDNSELTKSEPEISTIAAIASPAVHIPTVIEGGDKKKAINGAGTNSMDSEAWSDEQPKNVKRQATDMNQILNVSPEERLNQVVDVLEKMGRMLEVARQVDVYFSNRLQSVFKQLSTIYDHEVRQVRPNTTVN